MYFIMILRKKRIKKSLKNGQAGFNFIKKNIWKINRCGFNPFRMDPINTDHTFLLLCRTTVADGLSHKFDSNQTANHRFS